MTDEKSTHGISRRSFLKGTAAGALSLAGAAFLGTVAPAAKAEGETAAAAEETWYGLEPEISEKDIEKVMDVDVAVIGAGVAGVSAARAAAEAGAKTVIFEKAESTQGRGEDYAVINGIWERKYGREHIDPEAVVDLLMKDFLYRSKRSIIDRWAHESADAFDWFISAKEDLFIGDDSRVDIPEEHKDIYLIPHRHPLPNDEYDVTAEFYPVYPVTMYFPAGQAKMLPFHLQKGIDTGKLEAFFGHFAVKLLREEGGRVTGLIVKDPDGKYIQVNAAKGVVLATGDYENDPVMLKHFCPEVIENNIRILWFNRDVEGNPTNTGDGMKMGKWIGAKIVSGKNHAPMIHHMGGVLGIAPYLLLDKHGKRFCNEDVPGQQLENQIELVKDMQAYQIFDAKWGEQLQHMPAAHGVACYHSEGEPANATYDRNYVSDEVFQRSVDSGAVKTADSLEELLGMLEIDKDTALASIARYNELAKAGYDEDFHKVATRLFPIENGPFYAIPFRSASMLVCIGGIESDENCHAYDEARDVIPGLYVAGNMQGNRFAIEYPVSVPGISHSMALTYGKIAGENAANGI